MPSGWAMIYTGKFRNRAPTTSPYSRNSFSINGSGLRIRGNALNGPRGPGAIRAGRERDFEGAVGCATVEGLIPGTCSADIATLREKRFDPENDRPAGESITHVSSAQWSQAQRNVMISCF